jgi:hypothetical protein
VGVGAEIMVLVVFQYKPAAFVEYFFVEDKFGHLVNGFHIVRRIGEDYIKGFSVAVQE